MKLINITRWSLMVSNDYQMVSNGLFLSVTSVGKTSRLIPKKLQVNEKMKN